MLQRRHFQKSQFGQGMVEYAILLILTVTLVIGGIELASATLASGKASDAAKAGASDLAAINETRLKAQENQQKYLRQLEILLIDPAPTLKEYRVFVDPGEDISEADIEDHVEYPTTQVFLSQSAITQIPVVNFVFDNYVQFLDYFRDKAIRDLGEASINAEDIIDAYMPFFDDEDDLYLASLVISEQTALSTPYVYDDLADVIEKIDGITDDNDDGIVDGDDKDGEITVSEVIHAIKYDTDIDADNNGTISSDERAFNLLIAVQNLNPTFEDETGTMSPAAVAATQTAYKIIRLRALVLFEEIQLASLPLDPRVALSESTPLIGNHIPDFAANTSDFKRPACIPEDGSYTNGFPDVDDDNVTDTELVLPDTGDTINVPAVYLFNPLPVDAVSCQGNDAIRGGRSRMSILVGGYEDKTNPDNNVAGLPKLNQAFYGQYTRVCLNNANEYVACGRPNVVAQELLKPPGKLCLSTTATAGVDSCPGIEDDHIETSGYYFWGYGNTKDQTVEDSKDKKDFTWTYNETTPPEFRPTMQLICNSQLVDEDEMSLISGEACDPTLSDNPVKTVRINVRYRSVFESFLTFGLLELKNPNGIPNLADYFYDPSNLRALGNGSIGVSIVGSELGPKSSNKNPSVKQHKDFRGCYDINLETNSVTSCN